MTAQFERGNIRNVASSAETLQAVTTVRVGSQVLGRLRRFTLTSTPL